MSVVGGAFDGRFQIPDNPGQTPSLGLNVFGTTSFNSNLLNEVQHEATQFGLISLQKHIGDINLQLSAFVRNSVLSFSPDVTGDLLYNEITPFARRSDLAEGVQADASWRIMEIFRRMEIFRDEVTFVLNNTDIPQRQAVKFLKRLSAAIYSMKDVTLGYEESNPLAGFRVRRVVLYHRLPQGRHRQKNDRRDLKWEARNSRTLFAGWLRNSQR